MKPDISVIVVTYNSESVIQRFLGTLNTVVQNLNLSVETILTDNASLDKTQEIIRNSYLEYPRLNMVGLFNEKNVGLSRALNQMIGDCKGERILVCNPDIAFTESIREMLRIAELNPNLVLVPELLKSDGTPQRVIYRRYPTVIRIVSDFMVIGDIVPKLFDRIRKDYRYIGTRFRSPLDSLEHTSAVCMLVHRRVATMLSPFYDPVFPVYWNDVDMSMRAKKLSIQCAIVPNTKIYHDRGQTGSKGSPEKKAMLFYSSHGMMGYARRWDMHPKTLQLILFLDSIVQILREVAKRAVGRETSRLARNKGLESFLEATKVHLLAFRSSLR